MDRICGIYKLVNKTDGKVYVGQSADVWKRQRQHLNDLRANRHRNIRMQRAFNRDGESQFEFSLIEECTPETLTQREQYWLDFFSTSYRYNICPAAESSLGVKRSEESKAKMSAAKKGRGPILSEEARRRGLQKRAERWAKYGKKKPSREAVERQSASLKARWAVIPRKTVSDETRQKMAEAAKRRHLTNPVPRESIERAKAKRAARRVSVNHGA